MNQGFTESRTIHIVGALIFALGVVLVTFSRVLDCVENLGGMGVHLGLVRYSNFTGNFAVQHFAEDRRLLHLLRVLNETLLPTAETYTTFLLWIGVFVAALGFCVIAFPRGGARVLVGLHLLKPVDPAAFAISAEKRDVIFRHVILILFSFAVTFIVVFGVRFYQSGVWNSDKKQDELIKEANRFADLERAYYETNHKIGSWKAIGYEAPESGYFVYKSNGAGTWSARNKHRWDKCPAKERWRVSFGEDGVFAKELKMYATPPKDSSCSALAPDFRHLK
jgi:hypothetical protein